MRARSRNILSPRARNAVHATFWIACVAGGATHAIGGCSGWDPRQPFERNAPAVDQAIADLDAGRFPSAEAALEHYLGAGKCGDGGIGISDAMRKKANGTFDLGLTLFSISEKFGHKFGDEEVDAGPANPAADAQRAAEIDCALLVAKAIGADLGAPIDVRARAWYLAGNLEFMRKKYEDAVKDYDAALELVPGIVVDAGGDGIGRDVAHNRAIALRRLEDHKDADPPDAADGSDGSDDGGDDAGSDGGADGSDGSDDKGQDAGDPNGDAGGEQNGDGGDQGKDAGADQSPKPQGEDGGTSGDKKPPPQHGYAQDEHMLDKLEEAPTYQGQEAKHRANQRPSRAMEDK